MKTKLFILILLLNVEVSVNGQKLITGKIIDADSKKAIKLATVKTESKDSVVTTNFLGFFQIKADTSDFLIVSKKFYETGKAKVQGEGIQMGLKKRTVPEYEAGTNGFYQHVGRTIKYPAKARTSGNDGDVYVSFDIDSLGNMNNVTIINKDEFDLGVEVTTALTSLPGKWTPVEHTTTLILPVQFKLEGIKSKIVEVTLPKGILLEKIVVTGYSSYSKY